MILSLLLAASITFFCPCKKCCGQWSGGPAASGSMPKAGRTCAGPKSIPFGTRVWIQGIGERTVEDRTRSGKGWDVFVSSHEEAMRLGKQNRNVKRL